MAALYCLGALCACEDFDPPAPPSAAPIDAGSRAPGAPGADAAPSSQADAGDGPASAPSAVARATPNYVIVPDARDHAVAVIDPATLQVRHVPCGDAPELVSAAEDRDVALVVDVAGERACALHIEDGEVRRSSVGLVPHVNRVEFAPRARFALAFHDASAEAGDAPARTTQELSVIDLAEPGAARAGAVLAGLQPRAVAFGADGARAFVLSAEGIVSFDLAAAARGDVVRPPPLDFGLQLWGSATVRIAADAGVALAFEPGSDILYSLDLRRGEVARVGLSELTAMSDDGGVPEQPRIADAVISHDGAEIWVALRDEQALLRIPLPDALTQLEAQPSDRLHWVDGEGALLVYAEDPADGRATLVPVSAPDEARRVLLARAPDGVLSAESGDALGLLHDARQLPAGYTLLRVRDGAIRFRQTDAAPVAIALSSAAGVLAALVAASGDADPELHLLDFETLALRVEPLSAAPRALGFVGDGRFLYAQLAHPDGRLTFIDFTSGETRTATGFLIAERVRE